MKGLYRHGISADSGSGKKDQDVLKKDSSFGWTCGSVRFFVDLVGLFLLESLFGF